MNTAERFHAETRHDPLITTPAFDRARRARATRDRGEQVQKIEAPQIEPPKCRVDAYKPTFRPRPRGGRRHQAGRLRTHRQRLALLAAAITVAATLGIAAGALAGAALTRQASEQPDTNNLRGVSRSSVPNHRAQSVDRHQQQNANAHLPRRRSFDARKSASRARSKAHAFWRKPSTGSRKPAITRPPRLPTQPLHRREASGQRPRGL